jgi:hypothetical protein
MTHLQARTPCQRLPYQLLPFFTSFTLKENGGTIDQLYRSCEEQISEQISVPSHPAPRQGNNVAWMVGGSAEDRNPRDWGFWGKAGAIPKLIRSAFRN